VASQSPIILESEDEFPKKLAAISKLEWDSNHFGFLVGCLPSQDLSDEELGTSLERAKSEGFHLLYGFAKNGRLVTSALLVRYSGLLACHRANFKRCLLQHPVEDDFPELPGVQIRLYPTGAASTSLLELGVLASQYSRFQSDPRISRERANELFRIWTERSTQREIADAVFVAEVDKQIVGFVTVKENQRIGTVGLIATAARYHRRGIGRLLLEHAHRWMIDRKIVETQVSTQVENVAACQFYARAGYQLASEESVYHFWLLI
jgi:dTDP-4-amino-4,6-dideoxy-D-galactose acyltransferase